MQSKLPFIYGVLLVFLLALFSAPVSGLASFSGGTVTISEPTDDDVFATGGTIEVNAPVRSVTAAGGMVTINAPVAGDVLAAGGTITVNGDVGGKVIAAGGTVKLNGEVGTNVVIAGGDVVIGKGAVIARDATIFAGTVTNAGTVTGRLSVETQQFQNPGTAGELDVRIQQSSGMLSGILKLFGVLFFVGCLLFGLVLVRYAPRLITPAVTTLRRSPLLTLVIGVGGGVVLVIASLILTLIIIGIPFVIPLIALLVLGLLGGGVIFSSALGKAILALAKWERPDWVAYIL
ncbi:MAG: hypothetical protein NT074_01380, partial [Methanomicrobiales archaeon]|nr:hypothetical protein [Methanomicrobiales archaeon]